MRTLPLIALVACSGIPKDADVMVVECAVEHDDPFTLNTARVDGGDLEIDVAYDGGQREQSWYACWDGLFEENDPEVFSPANPPRFEVEIGHSDNGDPGRTPIESEVFGFDLSFVRSEYEATHDNGADSLIIVIGELTVQWSFE